MHETFDVPLSSMTTLRLGGPAKRVVVAATEDELIACISQCDDRGESVLLVGHGSNLVIGDSGFDGTVVQVATRGVHADAWPRGETAACGGVLLCVAAGEPWDEFVANCVADDLSGIEALSGIPGLVGATPMQNVGAYGQDVSQTIWQVRTYDRLNRRVRTFAHGECRFAYRDSRFKGESRYVILQVTYQLRSEHLAAAISYPELARHLGSSLGERIPMRDVREAVLALRTRKGMVLDPEDHDTWSAGSFFTNPVLSEAQISYLPAAAPRWPLADGLTKTSAAWLIEHAGFSHGYSGAHPDVSLSTKHTLALTNRGEASTSALLALAREVRDGVRATFDVELAIEPTLIGCSL
jgi:UDP-N-acetylmuramate dehydrogenase